MRRAEDRGGLKHVEYCSNAVGRSGARCRRHRRSGVPRRRTGRACRSRVRCSRRRSHRRNVRRRRRRGHPAGWISCSRPRRTQPRRTDFRHGGSHYRDHRRTLQLSIYDLGRSREHHSPSSPKLLFRSARHPTKALIGLLPTGTITTDIIGERISLMYGNRTWPDLPLWVCAVDLEHGKRVVCSAATRQTLRSASRCRRHHRSRDSSARSNTTIGAMSTVEPIRRPTPIWWPRRCSTSW